MLTTTLDTSLLLDLIKSQPRQIPFGSLEENIYWNSFWKFLKSETHLQITNFNNSVDFQGYELFLNDLTSGRNESKLNLLELPFRKSHNFKLGSDIKPNNCFFINEPDLSAQVNYRKNNGYFFSFMEDYKKQYEKLALLNLNKTLIIRENTRINKLKSWSDISTYLTPFTDLIFIDNYIFKDENLHKYNLIPLLNTLDKSTPVSYNLLFISYEGDKERINVDHVYSELLKLRNTNHLKFELSIFIAKSEFKEHDRGLFMNYLRIRSGDSFNYFGENGEILTKGTDIEFYPYTDSVNSVNSNLILQSIHLKIKKNIHKRWLFRGNLSNRLFEIT